MDACRAPQAQPQRAPLCVQDAAEDEEWRWRAGAGPPSASHHGAAPAPVRGVFIIVFKPACEVKAACERRPLPTPCSSLHGCKACHKEGL